MSISQALSNAVSGLSASARAAQTISSNVANAMTEGYGARELQLSARSTGGVAVAAVTRRTDLALTNDRRVADAALGEAETRAAFLAAIETAIGLPDDAASLTGRIAALEATLIDAASMPQSDTRLQNVLTAAQDLSARVNAVSAGIQSERLAADQAIASDVARLNEALAGVKELNDRIFSFQALGRDANGLIDQRQQLIDSIASVVPLREIPREGGKVALYAPDGMALLDGRAAVFSFTPATVVTAEMTLGSGGLSGLSLNGEAMDVARLSGGSLAAHFEVRDETAVAAQTEIDAFARALVERFAAADTTLTGGQAGLFTDAGTAMTVETGLAGRLSVSVLADPAQGGALWRLRDGLGAATAGDAGQAQGLRDLSAALTTAVVPGSGSTVSATDLGGLAANVLSGISAAGQAAENRLAASAARQEVLRDGEQALGVNTDDEMQKLLLVEEAYAANARVIRAVDEMLQALLEI